MSDTSWSAEDYEHVFESEPEDPDREADEAFWRAIEKDD